MLTIISVVFLFGSTRAAPAAGECPNILDAAGVSQMFAPMIAHSIHSLTLEDIRYFFEEDATVENGIPTVNMDLTSEKRVLLNAPLAGYDDDFSTMTMKTFDLVMRNMNRTWWGITNYNTLEKLTHAFHMAEVWDRTAEEYKLVKQLLDPESEICECITDVENNDVLNYLNLLAFKIKYPGITSGNKTLTDLYINYRAKRSAAYGFGGGYNLGGGYNFGWKRSGLVDFDGFDFNLSDIELLKDVAEKLVDEDGVITKHVDSAEHWQLWREMVKEGMDASGYYDLAVFLYCMLN